MQGSFGIVTSRFLAAARHVLLALRVLPASIAAAWLVAMTATGLIEHRITRPRCPAGK